MMMMMMMFIHGSRNRNRNNRNNRKYKRKTRRDKKVEDGDDVTLFFQGQKKVTFGMPMWYFSFRQGRVVVRII